MIVIAIMAIVLSVATLNFRDMKGKSDIEKQARELQSDITNVRLNAMQNKQRSAMLFGPQQYIYRTYTSDFEAIAAGNTVKTVSFRNEVRWKSGSTPLILPDTTANWIEFDSRGYANNTPTTTIVVMPITHSGGLDCIVVQTALTSIGRMEDDSTCRKQ